MSASRRVLKALSIFGSVQLVTMLCAVVRTKCIAMWLGATGIGIFGLYNTTIDVINNLTQLNLRQSGVRYIASAPVSRLTMLSLLVRRLGAILGIIGAIATILFSPVLSRFTFGDLDHSWAFVAISIAVFFNALVAGEQAVLQAKSSFKRLALASLWGGVGATVCSLVFLRVFGLDGIVPSIISFSVISAIAFYFGRDDVEWRGPSVRETLRDGKPILNLGVYMTAAAFTTTLSQYIFIIWMRSVAGDDGVGLYQAGYTVINQYVGLVFTAMAVEFYPRVSSVAGNIYRTSVFVSHELMFLLWGLLGCIVVFVNMSPVIIAILYDSSFEAVNEYMVIAAVGTIFKAVSFVIAFVILARGDGRIYLVTETVSSVLYVLLGMAGYKTGGLWGLGIAYVLWYMAYTASVVAVYHVRYKMYRLRRPFLLMATVVSVVTIQAILCLRQLYEIAIPISCIVVVTVSIVLYKLFLKRKTVKE